MNFHIRNRKGVRRSDRQAVFLIGNYVMDGWTDQNIENWKLCDGWLDRPEYRKLGNRIYTLKLKRKNQRYRSSYTLKLKRKKKRYQIYMFKLKISLKNVG